MSMLGTKWKLHGNGKSIRPGEVVKPDERLAWPLTLGIGMQHVVAMFGATFLVPIITGMPPATTLFFSGIGTLLFLVITKGRVPSYLGSSFAFIAPIMASQQQYGVAGALGGVVLAGVGLADHRRVVQKFGAGWINRLMPPIVTGAIVGADRPQPGARGEGQLRRRPRSPPSSPWPRSSWSASFPRHPGPAEHPGGRRGGLPRGDDPRRGGLLQDGRRCVGGRCRSSRHPNSTSASWACSFRWCWCSWRRTSAM